MKPIADKAKVLKRHLDALLSYARIAQPLGHNVRGKLIGQFHLPARSHMFWKNCYQRFTPAGCTLAIWVANGRKQDQLPLY